MNIFRNQITKNFRICNNDHLLILKLEFLSKKERQVNTYLEGVPDHRRKKLNCERHLQILYYLTFLSIQSIKNVRITDKDSKL